MERICNCKIPKNLQDDQIAESVAKFLAILDPKESVSDAEYERRLEICSACDALAGGQTCAHCGCLVLARSKKKDSTCPHPDGSKWKKPKSRENQRPASN